MILGFTALMKAKLLQFPGTSIKPAIVNQDVVENHFLQLRGANALNENPTYQLTQGTQNSIIFGQTRLSKKMQYRWCEKVFISRINKEKDLWKKDRCQE